MKILWCITGAGHLLKECCEILNFADTAVVSSAGEEVMRMYGIKIRTKEIILESTQGKSFPFCGRVSKKEYDAVVAAPCTSNTIAKIACGISDTLVTAVLTQALKSEIPVYVLPTDIKQGLTSIPITIDYEKCLLCTECKPMTNCKAFYVSNNKMRINLIECNACMKCISLCPYNAISFGKKIYVKPRNIDKKNIKKIREQGVKIINLNDLASLDSRSI